MISRRELLTTGGCAAAGSLLWVAGGPLGGDDPDGLAEAAIRPWERGSRDRLLGLDRINPEYDLMTRMFSALAFADLGLSDPPAWRDRSVAALDAMLEDTISEAADHGPGRFLLPYWGRGNTRDGRSLFVDGEILMIAAARQRLRADRSGGALLADLAATVEDSLAGSELGWAESYPDECWTFCNSVALAALRLCGRGGEHRARFLADGLPWLRDRSGMLVSSFRRDGRTLDGPEGSTIWLVAHMLRLVDPTLAAEQYRLARQAFGRTLLGYGWAREWVERPSGGDIDSGPIVPIVDASSASSGMAILAARSFGDDAFADALLASLDLAAVPRDHDGERTYLASNPLGDAVVLAALTTGPLWASIREA